MSGLILFDAVGTIIEPRPDAITAYFEAGVAFGSRLTHETIGSRFKSARKTRFHVDVPAAETKAASLPSSDQIERAMWHELVKDLFDDVEDVDSLFDHLWDHFANPSCWSVFDDVAACWSSLRAAGFQIGIASNFDSRLHAIVKSHPVLCQADFVFCSAEIGFRKPDPEFYSRIAAAIPQSMESGSVVMVGDDAQNDWVAPKKFGWQGRLINRNCDRDTVASETLGLSNELIHSLSQLRDSIGSL